MPEPIPVSIVIFWNHGREDIAACLRSLAGQMASVGGELMVVTDLPRHAVGLAQARFLDVHWVRASSPLAEARAWAIGVEHVRGDTVAFGQAKGRYAAQWVEALLARRGDSDCVTAGPVLLADRQSLVSKASYLCDYGAFADARVGSGDRAAAVNVAFDRRTLLNLGWTELDKTALLASGRFRVNWAPEMAVTLAPSASFAADGLARFGRGRHYASLRSARWPRPARLAAGLACLGLPLLLLARLVALRHVRRDHGRTLIFGFPWIAALLWAWSLGEMAGYWAGPAREGSAPRKLGVARAWAWMRTAKASAFSWSGPASSGPSGPRRSRPRTGRGWSR